MFYGFATRVRIIGRSMGTVQDYRGYYVIAVPPIINLNFGTRVDALDIYFLPGQRRLMLNKIKADTIIYLESLIDEDESFVERYELCEDFRQARIFITSEMSFLRDQDRRSQYDLKIEAGGRVGTLLQLHDNIKEGHAVSAPEGGSVIFVEPDD